LNERSQPLRINKIHPIKEGHNTSEVLIIINEAGITLLIMSFLAMYVLVITRKENVFHGELL
jgi:hypothetical protein